MANISNDPFKDRSASTTSSSSQANSSASSNSVGGSDEVVEKVAKKSFTSRGAQFFKNLLKLSDSKKVVLRSSMLPDKMGIALLKNIDHGGLREVHDHLTAFPKKVTELMRRIYRDENIPDKGGKIQVMLEELDGYSKTLEGMKGGKAFKNYVSGMQYFINYQRENLNLLNDPQRALVHSKERLTTLDETELSRFTSLLATWRSPQELSQVFEGVKGEQLVSALAKTVRHLKELPQKESDPSMIEKLGWAILMISTSSNLKARLEPSDDWTEVIAFLKDELHIGSDGKIENVPIFQHKLQVMLDLQPQLQDSDKNKMSKDVALNLCSMLQTNAGETWNAISKCYVPSSDSQDKLYKIMMDRSAMKDEFKKYLLEGLKEISFRDTLINDAPFADLLKNHIKKLGDVDRENLAKSVQKYGNEFVNLLGLS